MQHRKWSTCISRHKYYLRRIFEHCRPPYQTFLKSLRFCCVPWSSDRRQGGARGQQERTHTQGSDDLLLLQRHLFWNLPPQVWNDSAEGQESCANTAYNANPDGLGIFHSCPLVVVSSCTDQLRTSELFIKDLFRVGGQLLNRPGESGRCICAQTTTTCTSYVESEVASYVLLHT